MRDLSERLAEEWERSLLAEGLKPVTVSLYARDVGKFREYLAGSDESVLEVAPEVFRRRFEAFCEGSKPATAARKASCLRSFLRFSRDHGAQTGTSPEEVPSIDLRGPSRARVTPDESVAAIDAAAVGLSGSRGDRERCVLTLVGRYGLRVADAARIRREDLAGDQLRVGSRTIPMDPSHAAALRRLGLAAQERGCSFLFRRNPFEDVPMTRQGLWKMVRRIAKLAGVATNPRDLRNAAMARMVRVETPEEVSRKLGIDPESLRQRIKTMPSQGNRTTG